jgi:hypothetical protein
MKQFKFLNNSENTINIYESIAAYHTFINPHNIFIKRKEN